MRIRVSFEISTSAASFPLQSMLEPDLADRVVIVHSRGTKRKREFIHAVRNLSGREPTILDEHSARDRALVRKDVLRAGLVIVLLTTEEIGHDACCSTKESRIRQDLLFEMGLLVGALGSERVAVFCDGSIEVPVELRRIGVTGIDEPGAWRQTLARELVAAGLGT